MNSFTFSYSVSELRKFAKKTQHKTHSNFSPGYRNPLFNIILSIHEISNCPHFFSLWTTLKMTWSKWSTCIKMLTIFKYTLYIEYIFMYNLTLFCFNHIYLVQSIDHDLFTPTYFDSSGWCFHWIQIPNSLLSDWSGEVVSFKVVELTQLWAWSSGLSET